MTDTRQDPLRVFGVVENSLPPSIGRCGLSAAGMLVVGCIRSQLLRDSSRLVWIEPILINRVAPSERWSVHGCRDQLRIPTGAYPFLTILVRSLVHNALVQSP